MSTIKHSQISALLVDDDAKLCGLLRDYLEGFGFSLDVAEDASSGLEKAVANEYDVILHRYDAAGYGRFHPLSAHP